MRRVMGTVALAGMIVALAAVGGCGVSPAGTGTGNGTGTATGTATGTSANTTPLPSPTASVTPAGVTVTRGAVTVTTSKTQFTRGETISVYISNGLSQSIFVADHQTACSLVTFELQSTSGWRPLAPCRLMTPTRAVEITSGATDTQLIPTSATGWPTGTYRIRLGYALQSFGNPTIVYSGLFTVV